MRYSDKFLLDNFRVEESPDVGVTAFVEPVSVGCLYNDQQTVTIAVYNWSCNVLTNVPVTCEITGAITTTLTGLIPGPLPIADTVHFTFPVTFDMTGVGTYNFEAYTALGIDANTANDTLTSSIPVTQLKVSTFPYLEDFEADDGYWIPGSTLAGNYFEWNPLPGAYLGGPMGNGSSWRMVTDGTSAYKDLWIESPVFDFSKNTRPVLSFDLQYDLAYDWCDRGVFVQYSIDGGTSWTTLGLGTDPNWYNAGTNTCWPNSWSAGTVNTWTSVMRDMCELSGEECVKLRIYADDVRYSDGFAFDNVLVSDGTGDDIEPILVFGPDGGACTNYTATETVQLLLQSNNCRPLTNIPFTLTLTGPNTMTIQDTVPGPLLAFDRLYYTLPQTIDMSGTGTYTVTVTTGSNTTGVGLSCINDTFAANNTITEIRVANTPITAYPFHATFDVDNEGWASGSSNSTRYFDWAPFPYLGGAGANGTSWYIESYNSSTYTDVWVESPVFDLTGLADPQLLIDLQYELTYDWCDRGVYIQYSINGGTNWTTLGTGNDPLWYNPGANSCWPNTWSDGLVDVWTTYQHTLCDVINETCVQFRIYGNDIRYIDRFAFDNFKIEDRVDVGVIAYIEPLDLGCLFSGNQDVTVAVYNWSCNDLINVPITCDINGPSGATTLTGTIAGPIPANDSIHFTFPTTFSMTATGVYNFNTYTSMVGDPNPANDALATTLNVNQLKVDVFPYAEDFNASDGFWVAGGGDLVNYFNWGALPATYCGGPFGMGQSWYIQLDSTSAYKDVYLESPVFDFTQVTNPKLTFDIQYDLAYDWCDRGVYVQFSLDGGVSWATLGTGTDPNWYNSSTNTCWPNSWAAGNVLTWTEVEQELCTLSGEPCVKLRIYADDVRYYDQFALDNVLITNGEGDDVEPILCFDPKGGFCGPFTAVEAVDILFQNNSCRPIENLPFTFTMTGPNGVTIQDTVPGPIPSFGRLYYTMSPTVDMSGTGTYSITVTTGSNLTGIGNSYINDTTLSNNTITEIRYSDAPITVYPYIETFETNNAAWASGGNTTTRYFDRDSVPYLGGPDGNGNSWFIESYDLSAYSDIWVESPVFDFTGLTNPMLLMDIKYNLTYDWCDRSVYVQYSTNGGGAWTTLGTNADPNWYNPGANTCWPNTWAAGVDSGWTNVQQTLCDLIGETCVKFRIYGDDMRYLDMFAFDNFTIEDRTDVGVVAFIEPVSSGCLPTNPANITVQLFNWSCSDVSNIPVTCLVAGPNAYTINETVAGPIPAGGSLDYTFTTTIDITAIGTYDLTSYTSVVTDPNAANDTSSTTVVVNNLLLNTFPYTEEFNANSGYGGWNPGTSVTTNYFEWGALPGTYTGTSATNCWYLVRDGSSTFSDCWVESPVFDFTGLINPTLTFDAQYNLAYDWCDRGVYVQYSTNGGTSWTTLGTNATPNWYNSGVNTCWPNTWSAGTQTGWKEMRHNLCALVGESCVKLRIYADDVRYSDEFAFDNIKITDTPIDVELLGVYGCWGSAYQLEVQVYNNDDLCVASPTITSLDLTYVVDGGAPTTQSFAGLSIASGDVESLFITGVNVPTSASTIQVWATFPNTLVDQLTSNDTIWTNAANWPNCNDHCSNAYNIGLGTTVASQTSNATTNPAIDPPFAGCGNPTLENTVWYNFTTSPTGGEVTVTFENISCSPSANGIQVSIMELLGAPCDSSSWNEVYCANNGNVLDFSWGPLILPPNTTYYIAIDGFAGSDCDFDITISGQVLVLPIELINFQAECEDEKVLLRWTNATADDLTAYTVQRSDDAENFENIGTVAATNSNGTTHYLFADNDRSVGDWYYRLESTSIDGRAIYSDVVAANCTNDGSSLVVQPNPANETVNVLVSGLVADEFQLVVRDQSGRVLINKRLTTDGNEHQNVPLNIAKLESGAYSVEVSTENTRLVSRLVVVH